VRVAKHYVDDDRQRDALLTELAVAANESSGVKVEVTTPSTVDQEFPVLHRLGRVPSEFVVVSRGKPGRLYAARRSTWNDRVAWFRYSEASDRIAVRLR
jgi:hypothetical protein